MFLTLLTPLLMTIFGKDGPVGQYLKTKAEKQQADDALALQVQKDKMALSGILAQAAVDSEKNKLAATSQTFKAISFILINIPIIITCISKEWGIWLWGNMTLIPVWYAQMYVSIVFVIWGLPVVANATGTIFTSIQDAWAARQDKKIDKITAIGQAAVASNEQTKKEIFDIMKKTVGLQGFTQAQVDQINPVLDQALGTTTQVNVNTGNQ